MLSVGVAVGGLDFRTPPAQAHPAPYKHRHTYRPAPDRLRPVRRVRRGPERRGRLVTRWYMGAGVRAVGIVPAGAGAEVFDGVAGGGGGRLYAGVRITASFSVEFGLTGDFFSSAALGGTTLDLRWDLAHPASRIIPHVRAGVGYYIVGPLEDGGRPVEDEGGGGQLAAGVKWRFGKASIFVDAGLHLTWLPTYSDSPLGAVSANAGVEFDL